MKDNLTSSRFACNFLFLVASGLSFGEPLIAAEGLYRPASSTLRVASYNVMQTRILEGRSRADSWARMLKAINAGVWVLQETFYGDAPAPEAQGEAFRNRVEMVTGKNDWIYSWDKTGRYLLTRYPIRWNKELHRRVHASWIDLPPSVSTKDLVVINVHYRTQIDKQIAAAVDFLNEVRAGKHAAGIPSDASIMICGDFNQNETQSAYATLVGKKGFIDMRPSHPGATGQDKTIGNVELDAKGKWSSIGKNRIDFTLVNSSVLRKEGSFIFNTLVMPQADLKASGLKRGDVALEPEKTTDFTDVTIGCDHFAIITDFSDPNVSAPRRTTP
ncbi:MAG: endonuclease/exonuclease/phosphatase family protein [Verrucomicrobiales bacterium]